MLKIDNLTITTHKGRNLLKDFSFVLNENDKIALIGEEGNGKSTIIKIMAGIDVSDYVTYTGSIICNERIGYLPQAIEEDLLNCNVLECITNNDIDYTKLYSIIGLLKINNELIEQNHLIKTLSGGEKVKVSLARVLYQEPDILLLDEPTNDLDLKTLIWLEEFIKAETRPIIFISHDESLLENCSNGILHLEQLKRKTESRITYSGLNYKDYAKERLHFIERNNALAAKEKQELHKQLEKYRQVYQKVEYAQNTVSRQDPHTAAALKKKMHALKALGRNLETKENNSTKKFEPEEAINVFFDDVKINPNKVIIDYKLDALKIDDKTLCKDIELTILGKDKVCIIGDNGTGKTTLIKTIYEELKNRDDIKLGYMPQNYDEVMDYNLTPIEFLTEGDIKRSVAQTYLGSLKFTTEEMSHKISDLSQGQKCKILIIRMILDKCDVLLMDEPTRNLSPLSNPRLREILINYKGSIISISHDRKYIDEVCNKIYKIEDNKLSLLQ